MGPDQVEGFHARQKKIGDALKMNYDDKPAVSVDLRDIVVTMIVSYFKESPNSETGLNFHIAAPLTFVGESNVCCV